LTELSAELTRLLAHFQTRSHSAPEEGR